MYEIITFPKLVFYDPRRQLEVLLEQNVFLDDDDAAHYAELWLTEHPHLICMLVHVDTGFCANCDQPLIEIPGWLIYKWKHVITGGRSCQIPGFPPAKAKEPM